MNVLLNNSFFLPRQNCSPVFFSEKNPSFWFVPGRKGHRVQSPEPGNLGRALPLHHFGS